MSDHRGVHQIREEAVTPALRRHHALDAFQSTGTSPPGDPGLYSLAGAAEQVMEPLVTTRQLAELWCQPPRWVLRMAKEQGLPHYRLGGVLRYRASEAEAWLQQHRAGDTAGSTPTRSSTLVELRAITDARGAT
jgi:predicted DNA-binding transcriptional regulator AlpA